MQVHGKLTCYSYYNLWLPLCDAWPGSSVAIATGYGRIPVGARFSAPVQTGPVGHPASCTMGTGPFPGVKSGWGVTMTPHLLLVPWSRKSRVIPLLPLWAARPVQSLSACTVQLYLYFPYGPYGLYRTSVLVQECTLPYLLHAICTCFLLWKLCIWVCINQSTV